MQNKKPSMGGVWIFSGTAQFVKMTLYTTKIKYEQFHASVHCTWKLNHKKKLQATKLIIVRACNSSSCI